MIGSNADHSVELYTFDVPSAQFQRVTNASSRATAEVVSSLNDDGSLIALVFLWFYRVRRETYLAIS